ncbi:ligase-associated DNA damage response endonuclease PdeM [Thalassobaculum sp.]|uniref:ligase-associated DNA damage response endonuclease PdeM n=1 Tax=Thalassobaculum sp. TaxID=2022740 RepID=UPI0032ED1ABD
MTETVILALNGTELAADPAGVLLWPARRTLVVADLHLEKGSGFARRGVLLPPFDSTATLVRLAATLDRHRPERVICLGDSFHDSGAGARLGEDDRSRLRAMTDGLDWIWIAGNHDPDPPADWGGRVLAELTDGPLVFRHEAQTDTPHGEVSGHYHPKARVRLRGRGVSGRCFATDGRRLILPAFGAYTGGLDVLRPDLRCLFTRRFEVLLLAADRILRVPAERLMAPPPDLADLKSTG